MEKSIDNVLCFLGFMFKNEELELQPNVSAGISNLLYLAIICACRVVFPELALMSRVTLTSTVHARAGLAFGTLSQRAVLR